MTDVFPVAVPWKPSENHPYDEERSCPFVIETVYSPVDCQGRPIMSIGGPSICAYLMTDSERGKICPQFYHMSEVPLALATNCCWNFQMLVTRCVSFRTSYGARQPYFSIRRSDWDKDVHRCYEEPTLSFCPYCGTEIKFKAREEKV